MNIDFWKEVIGRGRLVQWLCVGGGTLICLVGGIGGWLDGGQICSIFLAMIAAAFGLETLKTEE